jgi:hypothetical protein
MRTIDEYLALPYTVRIIPATDAGGYVASVDVESRVAFPAY